MPRRSDDDGEIALGELICLGVEVISSTDPTLLGLSGKVVDETKNTLTIRTASGDKKVPKGVAAFRFSSTSGKRLTIEGRSLVMRPEDKLGRGIHG